MMLMLWQTHYCICKNQKAFSSRVFAISMIFKPNCAFISSRWPLFPSTWILTAVKKTWFLTNPLTELSHLSDVFNLLQSSLVPSTSQVRHIIPSLSNKRNSTIIENWMKVIYSGNRWFIKTVYEISFNRNGISNCTEHQSQHYCIESLKYMENATSSVRIVSVI